MKPTHAQLVELLRLVAATAPVEIDCDEFLARVGAFLECREQGGILPPCPEGLSRHIELCADCCEEFEVLLELGPRLPAEPPSPGPGALDGPPGEGSEGGSGHSTG